MPSVTLLLEKWKSIFEVNFFSYVYGIHTFLPLLRRNPSHIVNISSIAAFLSAPRMGCYSAAKAAVLSFSETLFAELKDQTLV